MSEQTHIINLPVASGTDLSDSSNLHKLLKVKSDNSGVVLLGAGSDVVIGSLERGNDAPAIGQSAAGMACAVNLGGKGGNTFLVVDTAAGAILFGTPLYPYIGGTVTQAGVSGAGSTSIGFALEARAAGLGGLIRAVLF
jgi:hypothetical protein